MVIPYYCEDYPENPDDFETANDAKSPNDAPLPPDAFYWKLEEETVIIQGLRDKTTPSVVVPHEIAGRPVVEIETLAFDNAELMQLILPKQLKKIGRAAFKDCSNLQRVAIPDGVEKIASWAFAGCASLTEVVIPQSVVLIENNVFDLCFSLEKISVDARNSAYRDVDGALLTRDNANFIRCPQAKRGKFAVPRGARRIHEAAFEHCRLLTEVIIPDSVEEFSNDLNRARFKTPFYDCRSLTTIRVAPENPRFRDVDGVILSRDFKTIYFFPQGKSGKYLVPASVEKIAENAFTGCARLNRVVVGRNVKTIEAGAFSSCSALTQIVLPKRLKIIKRRLFFDCPALTQVALPDELQEIDKEAFARCGALSQIVLPPNVAKIKANAFYDCLSLTKVLFNEALKEIGDCAFHNCVSLTRLEFPSSLQSVGKSAFCGCSHLTEIVFSDCAPMSPCPTFTEIVELEKHAASLDLFRRIANAARSGFVFTFFPNVWLKISAFAFYACSSLRCAHLSNAVYEIGVNAFANCDKLSDFTLSPQNPFLHNLEGVLFTCDLEVLVTYPRNKPNSRYEAPSSVKTILAGAFSNCDALREVVISENVNNIQDRVINQSIPYFNPSPPFIDCPNLAAIRVAPENTHYRDDDGVLLTRDSATLLRCPEGKTGKYVVPDGVEYISWNAFYNCSKLTEILFPSTLKRISEDAFAGCSSLSQIILPNGLEEVLQYAFAGCASLTQVVVPPSVKILDENAFANCPRLEPPELPDGVSYSHIIYD